MDPEDRNITCTMSADNESITCHGVMYTVPEPILTIYDTWFWIYLGIYVALVLFAGLASGLTLGLLSIDITSLKVVMEAGTPKEQKYAKRIMPIIKQHHILLVTLLLANAAAVESMPIFLDRISDPIIAIVVSVTAVLLFGEVFPQALCSRYGLAIGATLAPLVYFLMAIFLIISWPLAKILDCILGKDHGTYYRRAELKALVDLHGPGGSDDRSEQLSPDEINIIKGALEMTDKTVKNAMMPISSIFMLNIEDCFDAKTMEKMLKETHSRIPVYHGNKRNILGIIIVKTIIMLDPKEATPVRTVMAKAKCFRKINFVKETMPLYDLLNEFQTGKSHMYAVKSSTYFSSPENTSADETHTEAIGIITLEDLLEELLQEEIIDETDVYVDVHKKVRVSRALNTLMRSMSTNTGMSSVAGTRTGSAYQSSINSAEYGSPKGGNRNKLQEVARQVSNVGQAAASDASDVDPLLP